MDILIDIEEKVEIDELVKIVCQLELLEKEKLICYAQGMLSMKHELKSAI